MQTDQHEKAGHLLTLDGAAQNLATSTSALQGNTKAAGASGGGTPGAVRLEHTAKEHMATATARAGSPAPGGARTEVAVASPAQAGRPWVRPHSPTVTWTGAATGVGRCRLHAQIHAGLKETPHPTRCNK